MTDPRIPHPDEVPYDDVGNESIWVPDTDAAYELLRQDLAPGDVVLVKSSRDAGLRWLGDLLLADTGSEVSS